LTVIGKRRTRALEEISTKESTMFGIGMPEMLVILAVALIVIGPKKLPDLAKSLGRALGEFKRATSDLKESIQSETGLDEVRESLSDVNTDVRRALTLDDVPPAAVDADDSNASKDAAEAPTENTADRQTPSNESPKPQDTSSNG
jgi:sec-independent protein translocase protein TatB